MRKTNKRSKQRSPRTEIDHAKVERLRRQLEQGQLGMDFTKLVDGLAHAMQETHEKS